jgi:hypothetical protein
VRLEIGGIGGGHPAVCNADAFLVAEQLDAGFLEDRRLRQTPSLVFRSQLVVATLASHRADRR